MCDMHFNGIVSAQSQSILEQGLRYRIADLEKERESMLKHISELEDAVRLLRRIVKLLRSFI